LSLSTAKAPGTAAAAILRNNALFRELPGPSLERVALLGTLRLFGKGSSIFDQGDPGDALFAVASGRVRITATAPDGRVAFLNIMEPGDSFGEIAVMDGLPRTAGAVALDDCRLFVIRRADFLALLEREPPLAIQVLQLLCARLRWTSELVEESAFLPGAARLAKRLLTLAAMHGRPVANDGIELRISQADLAHFCAVSRQIVNQTLTEWRQSRWVELSRGRIVIRGREELRAVIRRSSR
jgi:CRP-like cAMP-binding protein